MIKEAIVISLITSIFVYVYCVLTFYYNKFKKDKKDLAQALRVAAIIFQLITALALYYVIKHFFK